MPRALLVLLLLALPCSAADPFEKKNLTAWCIVPFDGAKRGPEARVQMLARLGFTKYVYDWRAEHLPTFDTEVGLLKKAGITLEGVWFPAGVGKDGETLLAVLKKHDVKTDLWVMLPQPDAKLSQDDKVKASAELVAKLAKTAAEGQHRVGLYNHGGWTGEPENLVAVTKASGAKNVGIVYNLHHGHARLDKFAEDLALMKPYLHCLNLNGMQADGEAKGNKILCLGDGDDDAKLLKIIRDSKYAGPVGIIGHTDDDAEARLADNLNGLECLLRGDGFRPAFRTRSVKTVLARLEKPKPDAPLAFTVTVKGAKAELLKVYVSAEGKGPKDYADRTPMAGTTEVAGDVIRFTPRFAPQPGTTYRLIYDTFTAEFNIPKVPPAKPTEVERISPSSKSVPENLLRVYLHFTAPMTRGDVYQYVWLADELGQEVKGAFLQLGEELWSPDGKRLTLLLDPARVKKGLVPREEDGPILVSGKRYTVVVSGKWLDADGFPLKEEKQWRFKATQADEKGIDPEAWKLTVPLASRADPLVVTFDKPLDSALVSRLVWVEDEAGKKLDLPARVFDSQMSAAFAEDHVWAKGKYTLVIDPRLEDVCGNRVGRAFEVDGEAPKTEAKAARKVFDVK